MPLATQTPFTKVRFFSFLKRILFPGWTHSEGYPLSILYEAMWLGTANSHIDGRNFPVTDHHVRALSILGEADRALFLFQEIYNAITRFYSRRKSN